ncbi:signal peptidase II [Actinomadura parmotrematis]|uniref:Lipoprotein signal peptidase n=1 Tax=Actinomadura parmotrematis TaxID=2864039 RepID=A0ABS7FKZ2_9ACTN|nr:signal peptidase II [Actinomadura parmotrematis]MBW8481033.1 signal peptidase II [Actinomadura parmotrematis]
MLAAVAVAALALDVVSKMIVVATLQGEDPIELLGGLLTLRETRNSGAAFSIGTGYTLIFTVIAFGVVVAIVRTARNLRSLPWAVCLGLLLGGAIGNLIDRIFRGPARFQGHVVDWIELPHWPVFNLADSAIVCGGVLAVLLASRGLQIDGTRLSDDKDSAVDVEAEAEAGGDAAAPAPAAAAEAPVKAPETQADVPEERS